MLTAILLQIIKLMSTYYRELINMADATNGRQVARLPNLVKSAIEHADVPIKPFNLCIFLSIQ